MRTHLAGSLRAAAAMRLRGEANRIARCYRDEDLRAPVPITPA